MIIILFKRILGIICLLIALIGFILPIIPGWPFIVPAVLLLGRRDPLLRWLNMMLRHGLRAMRRSQRPWIRMLGLRLSAEYARGRRSLMPTILELERRFAS